MANEGAINPLTAEHKKQIDAGIEAANIGFKAINMAKMAGIDVSQQEAELTAKHKQLLQIKSVYFPNG